MDEMTSHGSRGVRSGLAALLVACSLIATPRAADAQALATICGSPFPFPFPGRPTGQVQPLTDDQPLFTTGEGSETVSVLDIASTGSLTFRRNVLQTSFVAGGMVTSPEGDRLYVTTLDPGIIVNTSRQTERSWRSSRS